MKKRKGERTFYCVVPVSVRVTATGYSDPGRLSGPPEDCYPPESECEPGTIETMESGATITEDDLAGDALDIIAAAFFEALAEEENDEC